MAPFSARQRVLARAAAAEQSAPRRGPIGRGGGRNRAASAGPAFSRTTTAAHVLPSENTSAMPSSSGRLKAVRPSATNKNSSHHAVSSNEGNNPLPTCAIAAHEHALSHKMLRWALEAGADLLPPTSALARRSAVLERPTVIDELLPYAEGALRDACALKKVLKAFCGGDVESESERQARTGGEDDATTSSLFGQLGSIARGGSTAKKKNTIGDSDEGSEDDEDVEEEGNGHSKRPQFVLGFEARLASATQRYNKLQQRRGRAPRKNELRANESDQDDDEEEEEKPPPSLTLRQHRELMRVSELALLKIAKTVEQGPGYILQIYKHAFGAGGERSGAGSASTALLSVAASTASKLAALAEAKRLREGGPSTVRSGGGSQHQRQLNTDTTYAPRLAAASLGAGPADTNYETFVHSRTSLLRATMASATRIKDETTRRTHELYALHLRRGVTEKDDDDEEGKQEEKGTEKEKGRNSRSASVARATSAHSVPPKPLTRAFAVVADAAASAPPVALSPWEPFLALAGRYEVPCFASMQREIDRSLAQKKGRKALTLVRQGKGESHRKTKKGKKSVAAGGRKGFASDDDEEEEDEEGTEEDDEEHADASFRLRDFVYCPEAYDNPRADDANPSPSIDLSFDASRGVLIAKISLSDAQMRALAEESAERTAAKEAQRRAFFSSDGDGGAAPPTQPTPPVISAPGTFLFQTEFVAIAPDVWLGSRGPWRGRVLHVARKAIASSNNACSALLPPPYLPALAQVLDACGGSAPSPYGPQSTATSPAPSAIDSIVVGPWVFVRREARPGGRPTDPYQCVGCGNTRLGHNIAYAAPDAPSGLRRGRYYCPYCRRATNHVNALLTSADPIDAAVVAARATDAGRPQWNRAPFVAPSAHRDVVIDLVPTMEPLHTKKINRRLHTFMGLQLI